MSNANQITGRIHSVETCGTVDGPGIRYIIFTQGCPLRCQYCHNPDTWNINSQSAKTMSVDEIMNDIRKYKSFMRFSGGGITISGGEPLMQPEFVKEMFRRCKSEGIHTTLDTSGFADLEIAKDVLQYTDLILLDIKSYNAGTFKNITGRELQPTLDLLKYTRQENIPVWIRFVLVPGLSDNPSEIHAMADFLSDYHNIEKIDILPFHKMGEYKWEELNLKYKLADTLEPSKEEVAKVKEIFAKCGFKKGVA